MINPVATCTLDLGFETVCDPTEHHEVCEVDDGKPYSSDTDREAPPAVHAE